MATEYFLCMDVMYFKENLYLKNSIYSLCKHLLLYSSQGKLPWASKNANSSTKITLLVLFTLFTRIVLNKIGCKLQGYMQTFDISFSKFEVLKNEREKERQVLSNTECIFSLCLETCQHRACPCSCLLS